MDASASTPSPVLRLERAARWLPGAVALVAFALYARTAAFPFIPYDDQAYVYENARVLRGLTLENARWALTTLHFYNWHPLTWLSYLLDVTLFGVSAGAMHLVNATLHASSAALLAIVLRRMTGSTWRSAVVAALFAVHPTRVESVAWIAERKDVLSVFFALVALLAYHRYVARPSTLRYLAVAGAVGASMASKAMTVTLPFLMLLLDVWPLRRVGRWGSTSAGGDAPAPWGRLLLEKAPLLAMSLGVTWVNVLAQHASGGILQDAPLLERLGSSAVGYVRYVGMLAWPSGLALHYPLPNDGYGDATTAAAVLLLVALSAGALALIRRAPAVAVGWFWFVGTMVPAAGIVRVGEQAIAVRYTYLPAIGLFIAAVWGLAGLLRERGRVPATVATLAVLAALVASTVSHVGRWRDPVALVEHTLAVTGPSGRAHGILSAVFRDRGDLATALVHARLATALEPEEERLWSFRGRLARDQGGLEEAEAAFRQSIAIDDTYVAAWIGLGDLLRQTGRYDEAVVAFTAAVGVEPSEATAWNDLGVLQAQLGRAPEALAALRSAVRASPDDPAGWQNLGTVHAQLGEWAAAAGAFARAAERAPGDPAILSRLAFAQVQAGDAAGARATTASLAAVDPAGAEALLEALEHR